MSKSWNGSCAMRRHWLAIANAIDISALFVCDLPNFVGSNGRIVMRAHTLVRRLINQVLTICWHIYEIYERSRRKGIFNVRLRARNNTRSV